jgi:hypothetical protein
MTKYRPVERTTKGGSIKQHYDIDWIFYAQFSFKVKGEFFCFSTTTRTLEEAEAWIQTEKVKQKTELGHTKKKHRIKINNKRT